MPQLETLLRLLRCISDPRLGLRYVSSCMPLYTSDCILVRKAHNSGRNHLANVRDYYACQAVRYFLTSPL